MTKIVYAHELKSPKGPENLSAYWSKGPTIWFLWAARWGLGKDYFRPEFFFFRDYSIAFILVLAIFFFEQKRVLD